MGRVEKQIIAGALALVAIFLSVVVYKGIQSPETTPDGNENGYTDFVDPIAPDYGISTERNDDEEPTVRDEIDAQLGGFTTLDLGGSFPNEDEDDRWEPTPEEKHTRAEPVEATFAPDLGPALEDMPHIAYTVRRGDSLSVIAQRECGSVKYLDEILELNETISKGSMLTVGQTLWLPNPDHVEVVNAGGTRDKRGKTGGSTGTQTHTVAAGDNLWRISHKYYGTENGIADIVAANDALSSKNSVLKIGMKLRIPKR